MKRPRYRERNAGEDRFLLIALADADLGPQSPDLYDFVHGKVGPLHLPNVLHAEKRSRISERRAYCLYASKLARNLEPKRKARISRAEHARRAQDRAKGACLLDAFLCGGHTLPDTQRYMSKDAFPKICLGQVSRSRANPALTSYTLDMALPFERTIAVVLYQLASTHPGCRFEQLSHAPALGGPFQKIELKRGKSESAQEEKQRARSVQQFR